MGTSQSSRRVVVEDGETTGVVKISESVVKRIRGQVPDTKESSSSELPSKCTVTTQTSPACTQLDKEDDFYRQSWKELEERNAELQRITNEQFAKAVVEVEKKFLKHTSSPVCQNLQSRVYECYLSNRNQILNCAAEVRAFSTCVERARQNALFRKG
ncbi:MICOS complex subunit MIC19-like [Pomacea canaliculata]|uniref:MICOS complex subunit MIC19-like n=1 Tax=Pomacea canaliculata TaxID=400727 RepID=UPI000D739580|nr:MICOS complex subunit MIC19-like [Pomacea canaliculata]